MTDEDLQAIRARAQAATPGPWLVEERQRAGQRQIDGVVTSYNDPEHYDPRPIRIIETDGGCYPPVACDATFIAAARTDVPALLAEVERLKAQRRDEQEALEEALPPQHRFVRAGTFDLDLAYCVWHLLATIDELHEAIRAAHDEIDVLKRRCDANGIYE